GTELGHGFNMDSYLQNAREKFKRGVHRRHGSSFGGISMLPITSVVAATAAIALIPLSISVSFQRMKTGVGVGFGDDETLMRRIRAQGNFVEYVPLALIVLGLAEYRGAP